MIRQFEIENYKSVEKLTLELGRINVLIGENGSGKSNILEAIAFAAAAAGSMLDNEFLVSRGIRTTEPRFMRSAFAAHTGGGYDIRFSMRADDGMSFACTLRNDSSAAYPRWVNVGADDFAAKVIEQILAKARRRQGEKELTRDLLVALAMRSSEPFRHFLVYSPENRSLRTFQSEGQILPLGIKGEGLFAHLKALSTQKGQGRLADIVEKLSLIDWFERFEIPEGLSPGERAILIRDRYLTEGALFDQRSANEGFLFLLFYFTLFISHDTPAFFAVDNVDASLNPKLCSELVKELVDLAKKHDKQAILTTHNPAVLDGLDLTDDEQRLLVIHRNSHGHTKARRVMPPKPLEGEPPMKLSEAFLRGYIGGLPKNF